MDVGESAERATTRAARATPIYVAGRLFSDAERALTARVAHALERAGYGVYLPQRDAPPAPGAGDAARVFRSNTEAPARAGLVVAVCEGSQVDGATAWVPLRGRARIPVYPMATARTRDARATRSAST